GEQYDDTWVTNNSIESGLTNTDNRGIATYQNGTLDGTTGPWTYFQTGGTAATFGAGVGYSLKRTGSGNYTFTGTFPTTDISPAISQDDNNWNLIGNPYPSYINIATFISDNTANIGAGAFQAIYVWNAGTNDYDDLTTGHIHPGQAFFINSDVASGTASISEAMQSHQTGITFYKNADTSIELSLSNGTNSKKTKINYLDGKTTSLDPGFDIGMFDGVSSDLSLYTNLVNDNEGIAFARQALPNSDLETMVIPIGIIADAGEITFSAETVNFPSELKVFLEDRQNNTFTRLDEANSNYAVTLTEKTEGISRFYLHTNSSALIIDNIQLENISIYKTNASTLRIVGLSQGKTNLKLFNILGKQVLKTSFKSNGVSEISLPKLATGVYIAQLENEAGKLNKKIVLE
ncbi:MAG: T9SS type A sorting domain-containing protein, partial [Polaribacter sp.]|nr:T9SS type A sorting domain-containing protein [Polaribacter sp.]